MSHASSCPPRTYPGWPPARLLAARVEPSRAPARPSIPLGVRSHQTVGVLQGRRRNVCGDTDHGPGRRPLDNRIRCLARPPLTTLAERIAAELLAKPVRRAGRRLLRGPAAVPDAEDSDVALHEARKVAKRARYAAEPALPALGNGASRQAAAAKDLQQALGDHHESVVARAVLLDLARKAREAGKDTFTRPDVPAPGRPGRQRAASSAAIHRRDACVINGVRMAVARGCAPR